ncbi:ubiquitin carboxyl-terminal hydrolase [Xylariaceae sp. FL0804]|nr:ubiquitin carboxyl-terminal hydrolase [Xylariaceae sp. FL0804]
MDQDSRSAESRERALSPEPSSTRPNPFDDGDLSARKRRRTSASASRSSSLNTLRSYDRPPVEPDTDVMKVDTPEPDPPSTPARSPPSAEPKSSKVTINLRNNDSREAEAVNSTSPTPARPRTSRAKVSPTTRSTDQDANGFEVEAGYRKSSRSVSSSPSDVSSPDDISQNPQGLADDLDFSANELRTSSERQRKAARFSTAMLEFPYRGEGEAFQDTVQRLVAYFRQQPPNADEAIISLHNWLQAYLSNADLDFYLMIVETYQQNRPFWHSLPELFSHIAHRLTFTKGAETKDLVTQLLALYAELASFLLSIDLITLPQFLKSEGGELDLISPSLIRILPQIPLREELYHINSFGVASTSDLLKPLRAFSSGDCGPNRGLVRFVELLQHALPRSPKRVMEYLGVLSPLVSSIARENYQKQSLSAGVPSSGSDGPRDSLSVAHECFNIISSTLTAAVDKSINNLPQEAACSIILHMADTLRYCLYGSHDEALDLVRKHRQDHPRLVPHITQEAISNEWRFEVYCKLIRSRQMQLRVSAVTGMCDELVQQWRRHSENQDAADENARDYLDYLAGFIVSTGIVDYILGPTCHPEITHSSFNIVGFLAVTGNYTSAHTDRLWQTFTTTQDPRVSEALARMVIKILNLFQPEPLISLLEKFPAVSMASCTPITRDLFDAVTDQAIAKQYRLPLASYEFCVRLIREASVCETQCSTTHPEIQQFAVVKLRKLLSVGPDSTGKHDIFMSCLEDIAARSSTTSGSIQVLSIFVAGGPALQTLVTEHNFTQLLVDELAFASKAAKAAGIPSVYANTPRRKFIALIITQHGSTIDAQLGQKLWSLLVGDGAAGQDDRRAAWEDLHRPLAQSRSGNPFLNACLREYLPKLDPSYYCPGTLTFVRGALAPLANDANGLVLDDEDSLRSAGLELLWQMILTAPDQSIEDSAILTLVNDVYVDSKCIMSYPIQRARRVHFSLVQRCLRQLKSAARTLKAFNDGTTSGDDEPMIIVVTDEQRDEQELQFRRTLKVLITLLRTLQTKPHFATADLRPLMLQSPSSVEGDLAELKYQSFDGDQQTEIRPLSVGLQNTAASLLASIREATGFDNYRLYYRGQQLTPSDTDICKSLQELDLKSGLILVKRELEFASSPVRIKPGASSLDIEILGHFEDLWDYLSMDETLARDIYHFLITLPADDSALAKFEDPKASYRDVFPLGQPFKSLYAIHALREFLSTQRLQSSVVQSSTQDREDRRKSVDDQENAMVKAMSLIVGAIRDPKVVEECRNDELRLLLSYQLVDSFVQLLKENMELGALGQFMNPALHERLWEMLKSGVSAETTQLSVELVQRSFEALLESCAKSHECWLEFQRRAENEHIIQNLLLVDERPYIRKGITKLIGTRSYQDNSPSGVLAMDFAELFWPVVLDLIPKAVVTPGKCEEMFDLAYYLFKKLADGDSVVLDVPACLARWAQLLASYTTTEDISHPEQADVVAHGLILLLHESLSRLIAKEQEIQFPAGFAAKLFSKHLFPPEDERGPLVPRVVLHPTSRSMLYNIVYLLVKDDLPQSFALLHRLGNLTSFQEDEDGIEHYKYELPQSFDRTLAIRSTCGYAGLRNLSNTCYLNSLFTQLFMNTGFRRFILNARVGISESHQLLQETQSLFAALQDSRRRSIDPQPCVDQIMTYEEMPIDIHNQMDVDEFYSLLFDRWEAQLSSESDRKALRSVYGGQLVQQVKSKECEHISERIEPFAAIQCDIKGKSSLEESLQAYVDGEIMEGDNKYKCSTCDRHVDAVKRACLKDIPDSLIFHLKRFDFNLRTLQRNKINDYFPFPTTIDMQPYTIEHLSDPSRDVEPDMFELVGILVHSGTAETGHYYSFIRERPSVQNAASWVEFNDEAVTVWDPQQMESACFGGQDYRSHFDPSCVYEKVYSAYMLFYQRSSSLRKETDLFKSTGQVAPPRSPLSPRLEFQVKGDNWAIVQRHCLYDPTHVPFVQKILMSTWGTKCSPKHERENLAMEVALGHIDQVASRAKDLPDFDNLKDVIMRTCKRCPRCCYQFYRYFHRHPDAMRMLLIKNSDAAVRYDIGQLFILVLAAIKTRFPIEYGIRDMEDVNGDLDHPSVLEGTAKIFLHVFESFQMRPVAWPEYFGTVLDFAKLGPHEAAVLLENNFLFQLVMIIWADPVFELPPQYAKMLSVVSRRSATKPPNYESIIALIDTLLLSMHPRMDLYVEDVDGRLEKALVDDSIFFAAAEVNILCKQWPRSHVNVFVDKLIQLDQNAVAVKSILNRLIGFDKSWDDRIYATLHSGITGQLSTQSVAPYLHMAAQYCQSSTSEVNVNRLMTHISNQCKMLQNPEGRAFFHFHRDIYDAVRNTGEDVESIRIQSIENVPNWAPSLLGCLDAALSHEVEIFLHEKIFQYGPTPVSEDTDGGKAWAEAMVLSVKYLAVNCLGLLRDTYVAREANAVRDFVASINRVISACDAYFTNNPDASGELDGRYRDLCNSMASPSGRRRVGSN